MFGSMQRVFATFFDNRNCRVDNTSHRRRLSVEVLEDRSVPSAAFWDGYADNAQHTALSTVSSQPVAAIRWQTAVDQQPQYSGTDLYIHYGSPSITVANTVIVPVKTGASDGFEVQAFSGSTGAAMWTEPTNYLLPPQHDWTPSYSGVLTPAGRYYFPVRAEQSITPTILMQPVQP